MCRLKALLLLLLGALLLTAFAGTVSADPAAQITWYAMSSGGGRSVSPNYVLDATLGQAAAGLASSLNYRLGAGFWYLYSIPQVAELRLFLPVILRIYP
jgi:hypothetical protein